MFQFLGGGTGNSPQCQAVGYVCSNREQTPSLLSIWRRIWPRNVRQNFGFRRWNWGRWLNIWEMVQNYQRRKSDGWIWKSDGNLSARFSVRLFKGKVSSTCSRGWWERGCIFCRGWYFQKAEASVGCLWDGTLKQDPTVAVPFQGEWDVKVCQPI